MMPTGTTLHSYRFVAMATPCVLHLYAADQVQAAAAFAAAVAETERIEKKYSRYDPQSFVSKINETAAIGGSIDIDDETAALLDFAFACHAKSDGLFDITAGILRQVWKFASGRLPDEASVRALLPRIGLDKMVWNRPRLEFSVPGMEIDLGGVGKEYAVDRAAAVLRDAGIAHGLIDLGGDLIVLGPHPDGRAWSVGLRDPKRKDSVLREISIAQGALATSGDYERCIEIDGRRYGHILDPRTGWPVEGLTSVSVLNSNCMVAGGVATIAMLKGRAGSGWLHALGTPCLWVDSEGRDGGDLPALFDAPAKP
jgi:thiamine biosynthesis lipoprotein